MNFIRNISLNSETDNELVKAFKTSQNAQYLSILFQRYMDLIYGVCLKYLTDVEKSKDAVMDIYEQLNTKLLHHEVDNFKGWIHVLTRNHCLMHLRNPKNVRTTEFSSHIMQSSENVHLDNEVFEKEENFKQLENCLQKLSNDQKECIELFFTNKKCYKEISILTGKEWNTIRSLIQNGKRNLKICMQENKINERV